MFHDYLDFEIRIEALANDGYPLAVRGPGGDARGAGHARSIRATRGLTDAEREERAVTPGVRGWDLGVGSPILNPQLRAGDLRRPLDAAEDHTERVRSGLGRVDRPSFFDRFEEGPAVQYFYKPFLEAFDPQLCKDLGVWYTPPRSCSIRSPVSIPCWRGALNIRSRSFRDTSSTIAVAPAF